MVHRGRPKAPPRFYMATATQDDWDELVNLRLAAEERLRNMGVDQWTNTAAGLAHMTRLLDAGEMYLMIAQDSLAVAGCFGLTETWEPRCWSDDPDRACFQYLQKVIVASAYTGQHLGEKAVEYALTHAMFRASLGVRLEATVGNPGLQARWEHLGFTYLRTVPGFASGVLMERRIPDPW